MRSTTLSHKKGTPPHSRDLKSTAKITYFLRYSKYMWQLYGECCKSNRIVTKLPILWRNYPIQSLILANFHRPNKQITPQKRIKFTTQKHQISRRPHCYNSTNLPHLLGHHWREINNPHQPRPQPLLTFTFCLIGKKSQTDRG